MGDGGFGGVDGGNDSALCAEASSGQGASVDRGEFVELSRLICD